MSTKSPKERKLDVTSATGGALSARMEALIEAIPEGVVMFGLKGELLAINRRFAELYGVPVEDTLCLDLESCRKLILSTVNEKARPAIEAAMVHADSDPHQALEMDFELALPEPRTIAIRATPVLGQNGQILGRISLHRDVTDKRAWEHHTRELADMPNINPFPVFKCDAKGNVRFLNHAAENLLIGLGVDQKDAVRIFPPDYREQIASILEKRTGVLGMLHEHEDRSLSVTFSPDLRRRECMVIVEDVTEHRRADEKVRRYAHDLENTNRELRETQAALVQSEKMASLGNLVAGVAHEINTPVGSINSNADVMVRALRILKEVLSQAPPEIRDQRELTRTLSVLEEIGNVNQTACRRIVGIVQSLRNFARLDEAERKRVDLHEGLESTLTLVHHEIKNRIEVVRDYGRLPEVECFPNQLNQVFMNILVNATHAIEKQGTITITTRAQGESVTVTFSDSGSGITTENLAKIFDPGFTTKGVGVGSGLGLAICYKIVKEHSGKIDVRSQVGRGTTFTITLPVNAPPPPKASRQEG
jgi:signal transduction histidine kinase